MGNRFVFFFVLTGALVLSSCGNSGDKNDSKNKVVQNKILQQNDGTISLKVDKADCYQDESNPASNTAEWSVVVSKSGRFKVWLSSATRDTTDLKYNNKVMFNILDNHLEAKPACDKIIKNSGEVAFPYFRADSYIGSLYIQDTGLYNVQLISEKILTKAMHKSGTASENSRLLSVFLTPETR